MTKSNKIITETRTFGNLSLTFKTENYQDMELLEVSMQNKTLCFIKKQDMDNFVNDMNNTISKYSYIQQYPS